MTRAMASIRWIRPYILERWDRGQQAIFRANPDYYGETPVMERVVVVFMDEDAALAAVQAGQVDIAYTYATHAAQRYAGYELVSYARWIRAVSRCRVCRRAQPRWSSSTWYIPLATT